MTTALAGLDVAIITTLSKTGALIVNYTEGITRHKGGWGVELRRGQPAWVRRQPALALRLWWWLKAKKTRRGVGF